jgi:lipoic acid synthetase
MKLKHAVITSVTRDDLPDGGSGHISKTIRAIRRISPRTTVEVLTPDFMGRLDHVDNVLDARPDVFGHNIETVERLYATIRGKRCTYAEALAVLRHAAEHASNTIVKSAMMAGHGETPEEVEQTLRDLLDAGCEAVCIGQYLRPSQKQREVSEYVTPERFMAYEALAYRLGFAFAVAGPFVRSSYRSEELMETAFAQSRVGAL